MTVNIFEKASRVNLHFDTPQGTLSVSDLWDLPLTSNAGRANLDDIAKGINRVINDAGNVSFVSDTTPTNTITALKFDIVKHIIEVKLAERQAAKEAKEKAEKKQRILALIDQKDNEALASKSRDELLKDLESL